MTAFTHYWTTDTWEQYRSIPGTGLPLVHTASNLFRARGVQEGDDLYVVTVLCDDVLLIGKMRVGCVCGGTEAAALLNRDPAQMWAAESHAVAQLATTVSFARVVHPDHVRKLRLVRDGQEVRLAYGGMQLDSAALRGVNQLAPASAALLDTMLPPLAHVWPLGARCLEGVFAA